MVVVDIVPGNDKEAVITANGARLARLAPSRRGVVVEQPGGASHKVG
jgi:hypothetical protein